MLQGLENRIKLPIRLFLQNPFLHHAVGDKVVPVLRQNGVKSRTVDEQRITALAAPCRSSLPVVPGAVLRELLHQDLRQLGARAQDHPRADDGQARGEVVDPARLHVLRSEEHTSELQSRLHLVCRLLLEKKKKKVNVAVKGFNTDSDTPRLLTLAGAPRDTA